MIKWDIARYPRFMSVPSLWVIMRIYYLHEKISLSSSLIMPLSILGYRTHPGYETRDVGLRGKGCLS